MDTLQPSASGEDTLQPSASGETAGSRTLPLRDDVAHPSENVFIPLDATAKEIQKLVFEGEQITFVRAPVAAGKTTLANYLATTFPEKFVLVETGQTEDEWLENLMNAYDGEVANARQAVRAIEKQKKALIMDEAHLLFGCPKIYSNLTKLWTPKIKILLFSAAGTGIESDGRLVATPDNIYKKFMWYPPIPDGNDLVWQLKNAEIFMDAAAVDFLMKICCGHRGIFMMALRWVEESQKAEGEQMVNSQKKWDLSKCVTEVRHSFEESDRLKRRNRGNGWDSGIKEYMAECRAVMVNGTYSELNNIPQEFIEVLFGGSRQRNQLNGKERDLTIAGFLVPERDSTDEEFVRYNWNKPTTRYGVANSLMAQYYSDTFFMLGYQRDLTEFGPESGSDLLARALPFMSFTTVVDNVFMHDGKLKTSLSPQALPYEDHYNDAFAKVFEDLGYSVSRPLNAEGKVDLIVSFEDRNSNKKTCAIETIMAHRTLTEHNKHAGRRFANPDKPNYSSSADFKILLTIGANEDIVKGRVKGTTHVAGVEVIGLTVSQAHDSYEVFVRDAAASASQSVKVKGPFLLLCDQVAKSFQGAAILPFTSVQRSKKRKMNDA